ncbi:uncharacterized protein HMF8227_01677 [Saliniradius amylolyticus]|uniref:DUF1315 domain-containing protein n=1 Tax=Saliniradius amylolyticus TaxID=2183582 RepID=A0A2S2E4H6_9ALTE|nr:DUF1315 family protein [Saliniradius amylolyticus]AWL12150.1 uncharacterized protein HMF8227_01677 [Saliniradius amylolyticus]
MNIEQMLKAMTPEVYQRLSQAVETGKWPDGSLLTDEQRETCMQAVMVYQARVLESDEHMTVGKDGNIVHKSRQQFKQELNQTTGEEPDNEQDIIRVRQSDF